MKVLINFKKTPSIFLLVFISGTLYSQTCNDIYVKKSKDERKITLIAPFIEQIGLMKTIEEDADNYYIRIAQYSSRPISRGDVKIHFNLKGVIIRDNYELESKLDDDGFYEVSAVIMLKEDEFKLMSGREWIKSIEIDDRVLTIKDGLLLSFYVYCLKNTKKNDDLF